MGSNEMCCACGGGASGDGDGDDGDDGDDEDEYGDDDEDEYGDDDEDEYGDDGDDGDNADGDQVCVDIDNGIKDDYNDGCAEYAQNTHWCGNYDTATFKSMEMCCSCVATGGETGGEMVAKEGQEKFVEFSGGDGKMGISEFEAFYNEYFAVSNSLAQIMQSSSSAQEMFNMYDTDGDGILWPNHFGELWDNLDNGDEGEDEYGDDEYGDDGEDEYGDDGEDEYGDDGDDGDDNTGDMVCVDIDNGIKDDYADGCAEYAQNTHWCGNYDTDTFKSMEMCCGCAEGGSTGGEMVDKVGQETFTEYCGGDGKMGISEFEAFFGDYFATGNSLAQIMQSSSSAQEMFNMYDTDGDGILWLNHWAELYANLDNGDEGEDEYGDDGEDEYGDDGEDEYGDGGEDEYGDDGED